MEEFDLDTYKHWYSSAWRDVLRRLLCWEPAAIDDWLAIREPLLNLEASYHETPTYDVSRTLIPQEVRQTLNDAEERDLLSLIERAFLEGQCVWAGLDGYDWALAKENINKVFARYGSSLP